MNLQTIIATSLSDAWFQTVYKLLETGRDFVIDQGSYEGDSRLEFDWITIHIKKPSTKPLLPSLPVHYNIPDPVEEGYIDQYLPYVMTGKLAEGESYTYGQRLAAFPLPRTPLDLPGSIEQCPNGEEHDIVRTEKECVEAGIIKESESGELLLNQIEWAIWTYKNKGHRNNQIVLQVAHPSDMVLKDPPCLRAIDTRIQDGKLHFFPYFRSWDLWGGFPANLAAIQMMKEYMAGEIGVEDGEIIATSKGLHLYKYVWELAEIIRGKTLEEFRNEVS